MKAGGTIAIIGNGPVPDDAAPAIASADRVIRFNDCRSFRPGDRTDVVAVCNTGRPARAMLGSGAWSLHPAVRAASAIWCVRDPATFAALRGPLSTTHPELDDFCDDLSDAFADLAQRSGKAFRIIGGDVHASLDRALGAFDPAPYIVPSSGMIVIADQRMAHPDADILLAGFTHEGWAGHPFDAERQLVARYADEGRLFRPEALASDPIFSEIRR